MKYLYSLLIALLFAGALQAQTCVYSTTYSAYNVVTFAAPPVISGPGFSLHWDFGDGSSIVQANPTHTYNATGAYTVCLTVYDTTVAFPICSFCDSLYINFCSFTYQQDSLNPGSFVFIGSGSTPGSTLNWSFGDGTSGTGNTVTHFYNSSNNYTVTMTEVASNGTVICTYTQLVGFTTGSNCTYQLTQPNPVSAPGVYQFDALPGTNTASITWDFGDGSPNGSGLTIQHGYGASGTYTACMTAIDSVDTCTYCLTFTVNLNTNNNCYFTSIQDSISPNLYYFFGSPSTAGSVLVWDMGDGTTYTGSFITHQYAQPGVYLVCMNEIDTNGVLLCSQCQPLNVNNIPACNFTYSVNPSNPLEVTFYTNQGSGQSFIWDFGSGNTVAGAVVTYTFPNSGTYNVCLTVGSGGAVVCTGCQSISVSAITNCQANFTSVSVGLNAYFIDQSSFNNGGNPGGTPVSYLWSFGDGSSSTLQFPQHQYSTPGVYTVCLTISNSFLCSSTYCDSMLIDTAIVNPIGCNAYFIFTQLSPFQLVGVNLSNGNNISFSWDFGDGSPLSTQAYPSHQYTNTGSYQICLTVADNSGCSSTYCDSLTVDSLGNIVYRSLNAGFVLNILSPLALSIDEVNPTQISGLYPVPASNEITVLFADKKISDLNYRIMSVDGKNIRSGQISGTDNIIHIQQLNAGIYFLEVVNEKGQRDTRKFVKQ